jgi:hypothetical protein
MRKGPGSVYDKWNISVVNGDTDNFRSDEFNLTKRNPFSVASLLAANLYQDNPDRNYN